MPITRWAFSSLRFVRDLHLLRHADNSQPVTKVPNTD